MMTRDQALSTLRAAEAELRSKGVAHAALFGSMARGEARLDSDIDVMIEIEPDREQRLDLYDYIEIVHAIEDLFPSRVDVADRAALKPLVRPSAERDAIYAF